MIKIRPMTESDSPEVAELSGQLGYPCSSREVESNFGKLIRFSHHAVFVAVEHEKKIVGWIHVFAWPSPSRSPVSELGGLIVDKDHRNLGIGRLLLQAAEAWTLEQGYNLLRFSSRATRTEAHQFYKGQGYDIFKNSVYFSKKLAG